jgi:hypothetical protein
MPGRPELNLFAGQELYYTYIYQAKNVWSYRELQELYSDVSNMHSFFDVAKLFFAQGSYLAVTYVSVSFCEL